MHREGRIVRWEAGRAFGFIRSPDVVADVFVHLRDFKAHGVTPHVGMAVRFDEIHVGGKGPRAVQVYELPDAAAWQIAASGGDGGGRARAAGARQRTGAPRLLPAGPRAHHAAPRQRAGPGALLILAYAALLLWAAWVGRLPWAAPAVVGGLSLLTFFVYGHDKQAAREGRRRTPENTLHLLALAGGWPGAWCAQRLLRHKSSKASFISDYRGTVLLHVAAVLAWVFWLSRTGGWPWR